MHVVAFNGSPRKESNTDLAIQEVFKELEPAGITTELISLRNTKLHGCIACFKCFERQDGRCALDNDQLNEFVEKMRGADGIILGSPTYFAMVTTEMKALMDRAGLVAFANEGMLRHKIGAAVAVARRVGSLHVYAQLTNFFSCFDMFTVGSNYPVMALGMDYGDVAKDDMGMATMRNLGKNMAFLLNKVHG